MHPLLLGLDLPGLALPLRPVALAIAVLGLGVAAAGRQDRGARTVGGALVLIGLATALLAGDRALSTGPLTVTTWGALLAVALVAAWRLTVPLSEAAGLTRDQASMATLGAALGGLLGARLLAWASAAGAGPRDAVAVLAVEGGGLALYGAIVGGLGAAALACHRAGARFWDWGDAAAPAFGLGLAVGRLGCWLTGCDHGRPLRAAGGWLAPLGTFPRWTSPEALTLPGGSAGTVGALSLGATGPLPTGAPALGLGSPAWLRHVEAGLIGPDAVASLPVHPVQLYEAAAGLALLALALAVRRRRAPGAALLTVVVAYAGVRFGLEALRDESGRVTVGPWLPAPVALGLGLATLGALAGFGPARLLPPRARLAARGALFAPALLGWMLVRRGTGSEAPPVQLSVAQWCALGTALAAALLWDRLPGSPADRSSGSAAAEGPGGGGSAPVADPAAAP